MTNPVSGGFQFTPPTGLNDVATYPTTPVNETAARQQVMDLYWQLMNEMNLPTLSAAAYAQYNRLINGGFAVNQRVVSGTVTLASGAYGHDRWKAGAGGCTYTFATVNNVTTITITAGSLVQVIEGINLVSGTYTLSWIGTAQGKIGAGAFSASGVTGAAAGGTNLSIEFNVGTLSKVQFNVGDQALPFQPRSFAEELQLCQRYYEKSYGYGTVVGTTSNPVQLVLMAGNALAASTSGNVGSASNLIFKVRKRTNPTVMFYAFDGTINAVQIFPANTKRIGITNIAAVLDTGLFQYITFDNSYATPINAGDQIAANWTADAEL